MDLSNYSFKQLIERLDLRYYDNEISKIKKQINNINLGRNVDEGINRYYSGPIYKTQKQEDEAIKRLEKQKMYLEQEKAQLTDVIMQLKNALKEVEKAVKKEELFDIFRESINLERPSISNKMDKKYDKITLKLYNKDFKTIPSVTRINSEMYNLLRENNTLKVLDRKYDKYKQSGDISVFSQSIKQFVEDSGYDISNMFTVAGSDISNMYRMNLSNLNIDVTSLEIAKKNVKEKFFDGNLTLQGKESLKKYNNLDILSKNNNSRIGKDYKYLLDLKYEYSKIMELSREIWYMESILYSFSKTDIASSEMYLGLQELKDKYKSELSDMVSKTDSLYEKYGFSNKIDDNLELEELFNKIKNIERLIYESKKSGDKHYEEQLKEQYYNLRYKMFLILQQKPELNKAEYNINIERLNQEKNIKEEVVKEDKNNVISNAVSINNKENEKKQEKDFTIDDTKYQAQRTSCYNSYMVEKVKGTNLGKIPFSEYLANAFPQFTELIEIEKKREELANTIYKDYIIFLAPFENKKSAMSFEQFASIKYNMQKIDVPIQYEEEYKGMRK